MAMYGSWTFVHAASQHSPPPTASYIHLLCAKAAMYDSFRPANNTHLCRYMYSMALMPTAWQRVHSHRLWHPVLCLLCHEFFDYPLQRGSVACVINMHISSFTIHAYRLIMHYLALLHKPFNRNKPVSAT